MHETGYPDHFGQVVNQQRRRSGRTQEQLRAAGGPAVPTQVRAEAGLLHSPKPSTMAKYDAAFDWEPGSAARVFWDKEPTPARQVRAAGNPLQISESPVAVPVDQILVMLGIQRGLTDLEGRLVGAEQVQLQELCEQFKQVMSVVVGGWVTSMLEHNRGHPGLSMVLADAMASPVEADDPAGEERLYRRWLHDPTEVQLSEALSHRFEDRFQRGGDDVRRGDSPGRASESAVQHIPSPR
ncbi:hypothetical protein [Nocardia salmonicida]|uniref:hypothetical protein n=1 Tax=Nocardia salmonicida TaxID=53431 RepID=UPI003CF41927